MTKSLVTPVALRQPGDRRILWRCFRYLRPYRRLTGITYVVTLLITALSLFIPQLMRWIVDNGIRGNNVSLLA